MKKFLFTLSVIILSYLLSFILFLTVMVPGYNNTDFKNINADAIVVLTGANGRIQKGIELLSENKAKKLLITGVGQKTNLKDIEYINEEFPINYVQNLKYRITLGYEASNTKGNAKEATDWLQNNNFNKIILVTSDYHMPRSILEFTMISPDVDIIACAVDTNYLSFKDNWKMLY